MRQIRLPCCLSALLSFQFGAALQDQSAAPTEISSVATFVFIADKLATQPPKRHPHKKSGINHEEQVKFHCFGGIC
jgi:hypothetical protein